MSRIKAKETKPEIIVRKYLFSKGLRYRKNDSRYPGKPDLVLPKYNSIIFVNGCFWHGHDCKYARLPDSNKEFWSKKINKNIERDKANIEILKKEGWNVLIVWSCELKTEISKTKRLNQLYHEIISNSGGTA